MDTVVLGRGGAGLVGCPGEFGTLRMMSSSITSLDFQGVLETKSILDFERWLEIKIILDVKTIVGTYGVITEVKSRRIRSLSLK